MTRGFVHLHNHTEYSMLDGAAKVKELMRRVDDLGMPAVAMTDHGNVFAAYDFWKAATDTGINPVIGVEAYMTPGTHRLDKTRVKFGDGSRDDVSAKGAYTHMTLWAATTVGMHNLFRLTSLASLEGHLVNPRMDRELLATHGAGLIGTTGCPSGEVQTYLRFGKYQQALAAASDFRDILGTGNYYVELMDHGLNIEKRVRDDLLRLARDLGLPLVATNDLHYIHAEDAKAHAALLCINSGSTLSDPDRFKFESDEYYVKSADQMRHLFRDLPEACDATLEIAERCSVSFVEQEGRFMPRFPVPAGESETSWFVKEVETGLRVRWPGGVPDAARRQAEYETKVITEKGYCFPPDTPVLMGDGTWKEIGQVKVDDEMTSVSEWDFRPRRANVEKVLTREVNEDLTVIRPYGQVFPIKATCEHPFLVATKGWVAAKDVQPGDQVLVPQPERPVYEPFDLESRAAARGWLLQRSDDGRITRMGTSGHRPRRPTCGQMAPKVEWSTDLMWLMGLWVAEGHVVDLDAPKSPGQIGWTLHKDEPAVARLCEVIKRLDLGSPRIYSKKTRTNPDHKGIVVMLTNHPLALFLKEVLGSGVREKCLHEWVSSVPDEGLWAFVEGWHEGDGHVRRRAGSSRWMVSTVSPTLARQLRSLLLAMGQWATVTYGENQTAYKVNWTPSNIKNPYNAVCVEGRWWVKVRSVESERYQGAVYNLTVAGDHTYVAEGVAVHNCGYFLVVADFINWAKSNGIRVGPGRGSGAGSICAYAMRITDLDPLQHGLIFERFLNPERPSLPDFDVDFDEQRRAEVIRYVVDKYGDDRVSQIVTFGTIKSRQAIKDANRVLGHPYNLGEQITKAMPSAVMGKDIPLADITDPDHPRYRDGHEFRALLDRDPTAAQVAETARGIEGIKRQWGVHAAGVIMSSEPLLDIIPVMKRESDGAIITQFDYPSCEALGLVKMDFLGLRNLTILEWTLANIAANEKTPPVLEDLPLDDPDTFRLMASGATLGVFQLDGGPMRSLLKSMRPDCFEDISAVLALYRPGPMGANSHNEYADRKNDRKPVTPIHPELAEPLAPILDETYGLIVYQEQVQEIAVKVAGYTLGTADLLRRAMGKKKKEVLDAEYENFSRGMSDNGYSESAIDALWRILVPFSDYAFNKAHTAAYGLLAYWTGYLKAHYPAEYMAALLTSVSDDKDKMAVYLYECRRIGLTVLQPDVNESDSDFTPVGDDTIRFGLSAIRNVGVGLVAAITRTRDEKGKFADFPDYLAKCPQNALNKKAVDSLIKAGAFDSLGHSRRGLAAVAEALIDIEVSEKKHDAAGMDALFALDDSTVPTIPDMEWDRRQRLTLEREMLGLYVSDHPLHGLESVLEEHATMTVLDILTDTRIRDATPVTVAGLITATKTDRSKRDDRLWATVLIEDLTGTIACLVFPNTYENTAAHIRSDTVCAIRGKISRRDETPTIYVDSIRPL